MKTNNEEYLAEWQRNPRAVPKLMWKNSTWRDTWYSEAKDYASRVAISLCDYYVMYWVVKLAVKACLDDLVRKWKAGNRTS